MTPEAPKTLTGGYAAILMIGEGHYPVEAVEGTLEWHRERNLWISGRVWEKLAHGMPVVARMAGPSNELLMTGVVAGEWHPNTYGDDEQNERWPYAIQIAWERNTCRGVLAADLLGSAGKSRAACMTVSRSIWAHIYSRLVG